MYVCKKDAIIEYYVDDYIVFLKNQKTIRKIFNKLKKRNIIFTKEGDVSEYLRIKIVHNDNGSMSLLQPYLLKCIIETIPGMDKANLREIFALPLVVLTKDENGKLRRGVRNYRSVIGILNFVTQSTHLEIAFAIHQYIRFCDSSKLLHNLAIQQIIKYILSTQND